MSEGLAILLGKKPSKAKEESSSADEGPDEYDALARGLLRAVKAGDAKDLARVLRDCSLLGPAMDEEDEDY